MTTPEHPDAVREALREAAERRSSAERDRAAAMLDTAHWVAAGKAAGLSVTELSRLSGLSRPTIYQIIEGLHSW